MARHEADGDVTTPLISCIVAVYNGERYLAAALDSILAQTYQPIEVLVVDDGSTDATAAIARRYGDRVRLLQQANAGPAAARNLGLRQAAGDFVAFLDADDLWHERKLATQMRRFDDRPDLGLCVTRVQNFWEHDLREEADRFRGHRLSQPTAGYSTVALLARRSVFEAVGPFETRWHHIHDTDWFIRAGDAGIVSELVPEVLVLRRFHGENRSRTGAAASRLEYLELVRSRIAKGRPAPGIP